MVQKSRKVECALVDGSLRSSNHCLRQAYVNFGEHTDFVNFHVMKLCKYDAILGKS